jgi:hypothetical protein
VSVKEDLNPPTNNTFIILLLLILLCLLDSLYLSPLNAFLFYELH